MAEGGKAMSNDKEVQLLSLGGKPGGKKKNLPQRRKLPSIRKRELQHSLEKSQRSGLKKKGCNIYPE